MTSLSHRSLRTALLLAVGLVAAVAIACGGGDESPEPAASPAPTEAPATEAATEAPTEVPPTEAAATEPPATDEGSVDETYLRAVCIAGNDLQSAMFTAAIRMETEGVDPDDPEAFQELFVEPLAGFLEAMREFTPPDDVAEYHAAALAQYEALVEVFASVGEEGPDGDPFELLGGMLEGASEIPVIPQEALDRLAGVAEGIPDCAGSIFLPAFLGQQGPGDIDAGPPPETSAEPDPEAEAYVRALCLAGDTYEATIQEAVADMGPDADLDESDPEVFFMVFGEAIAGLARDMALVTPPDAFATYHAAATERFDEMSAVLEGIMGALDAGQEPAAEDLGRFQQLLQGGLGMRGLPLEDANRLAQAANNVIECYNSGFLYGFLGGGQ